MPERILTPASLSPHQLREIEDCGIAFHDALTILGDFEGRELLECVHRRLERAAADLRSLNPSHAADHERTDEGGSDRA